MLKTTLLPHQHRALDKLEKYRVGALFMDMGCGKTRTSIELIERRMDKISSIVWFCPVSIIWTIKKEFEKHTEYKCGIVGKTKDEAKIWICGIQSIVSDRIYFEARKIIDKDSFVICDESIFIKNPYALRTKRITALGDQARYRLILNGTPISRTEADLYCQFRFLSPKILGFSSYHSFAANHLVYSEKYKNKIERVLHPEVLARKIAPFTYQVKKEECYELKDKRHNTIYYDISIEAKHLYNTVKRDILDKYEDDEYFIFRLFNNLQQITCGFSNYTKTILDNSAKEEALLDYLSICENEKVIILSKYVREIESIKNLGTDRDIFMYYGKQKDSIEGFLNSQNGLLIGNHKCLGYGHNLQECSRLVLFSNPFNYSDVKQSEDRVFRPGQQNDVFITSFVAINTIDEYIVDNLRTKQWKLQDLEEEIRKIKDKKTFLNSICGGFDEVVVRECVGSISDRK
jgi:SNF2 family DNA or RNA helicase